MRALFGALIALSFIARAQAQSLDAAVVSLDASVADAGARDASTADGGAPDTGTSLDAGKLDLDLPEQGCQLAHGGDAGGALVLLLALVRRRRS